MIDCSCKTEGIVGEYQWKVKPPCLVGETISRATFVYFADEIHQCKDLARSNCLMVPFFSDCVAIADSINSSTYKVASSLDLHPSMWSYGG